MVTARPRVRIATCRAMPEEDVDQAGLLDALARAGVDASLDAWDDPGVAWDAPVATVVRSTWNYYRHADAFARWLARVAAAAPLYNPLDILTWNTHKRYLAELAARGVDVVPTAYVSRGGDADLEALARAHGWSRVVVKPAVSAGSFGTRRIEPDALAGEGRAHLAALLAEGDAMVQPHLASVARDGERSVVWIDGAFTHVVCKAPRFAGGHEAVTGPYALADDERALATLALAPFAARLLYGRVDIVRDDEGRPMVLELELVEPSLHLRFAPHALERLAAAIARIATR